MHIDDSDLVLHVVKESLKRSGFQVMSASQLGEINGLIELHGLPDLIVLDINMPEVQGDDLATFFREQWGLNAPIVLFSDSPRDEISRLLDRVGAAAGIKKEDGVMTLIATIRQELKTRVTETQMTRLPTKRSGSPIQSVSDDSGGLAREAEALEALPVALREDSFDRPEASGSDADYHDDEDHYEMKDSATVLGLESESDSGERVRNGGGQASDATIDLEKKTSDSANPESPPPPPDQSDIGDAAAEPPPPALVPYADGKMPSGDSIDDMEPLGKPAGDEDYVDLDSLQDSFAEEDARLSEHDPQAFDSLADSHDGLSEASDEGFGSLDNSDGFGEDGFGVGEDEEHYETDVDVDALETSLDGTGSLPPAPEEVAPSPAPPVRPQRPGTANAGARKAKSDTKRRARRSDSVEPAQAKKPGQPSDTPPRRLRRGPEGQVDEVPGGARDN